MDTPVTVGESLAFRGFLGAYVLYEVAKISPAGRITCGPYQLNRDLSIRGCPGRFANKVTPEIQLCMARSELGERLCSIDTHQLTMEQVEEFNKCLTSILSGWRYTPTK